MSSSALAAGIRHLRRKLAAQQPNEDSDEQLLHAFTSRRDDSAFAVLVRRHGPMVLHVCRRVLGHEQDAEDAFQATFLVLTKNAVALRNKATLASFLHGTAYRTAMKAKQTAARRRKYEGSLGALAQPRSPADPADELAWREVQTLLDEEIARLPEIYRSVFVLCSLECISREAAARRLGLKEGTVSSRLTTARKRLAKQLARRGAELTAVLATAELAAQSASALPVGLTATTLKAVLATAAGEGLAGIVSASVAELVQGMTAAMMVSKAKIATVVLLLASLLAGAGTWAFRSMAVNALLPSEPPAVESSQRHQPPSDAAQAKTKDRVIVRGRVLGPDGRPVKGAHLYSPHFRKDGWTLIPRGISDAEGRFRVEWPRSDVPKGRTLLVAAAGGYGIDWADLPDATSPIDLTLRLVKDQSIEGRILNTEGKPVADAHVRVGMIFATPNGNLDAFLNAWRQNQNASTAHRETPKALYFLLHEILKPIRTGRDGRFRITGVGCERVAVLQVNGPGIARASLHVVNRAAFDPAPLNKAVRELWPPEVLRRQPTLLRLLYGSTLDLVASASRPIEGTVREAGSGKPVAGMTVWSSLSSGYDEPCTAVTDKEGHYRLEGMPRMKDLVVEVRPEAGSAWLPNAAKVPDRDGIQPLRGDLALARGAVVTGRVIDRTTGNGLQSILRFAPLPDNKYLGKQGYGMYTSWRGQVQTDAEGRFRLVTLPGPGVLIARTEPVEKGHGGQSINPYKPAEFDAEDRRRVKVMTDRGPSPYFYAAGGILEFPKDAHALRYLELAPDADPINVDLFVDRGRTLTVKIEDADGKALSGTTVAGVTASWPSTFTMPKARCTVYALDPQQPRRLIFYHAERRLAASLTVRGDEKEAPVARLAPTGSVIGRVVDEDGRPIAQAGVLLRFEDSTARKLFGDITRRQAPLTTDKEGRFRIDGVIPQLRFALGFRKGRVVLVHDESRMVPYQVKPSETLDLGEFHVNPFKPSP